MRLRCEPVLGYNQKDNRIERRSEGMREGSWFQKALTNFTREAGVGGAVRHLTDLGYTVEEIRRELAFPASYESVRSMVWKYLVDTQTVLCEDPRERQTVRQAEFVREYDRFGKPSFRRVMKPASSEDIGRLVSDWRERTLSEGERFETFLRDKTAENGVENSYVSCDFGTAAAKEPDRFGEMLLAMEKRQREYVEGLPWERDRVYHRLTSGMTEIVLGLYRAGMYRGICCFLKTGEWMEV